MPEPATIGEFLRAAGADDARRDVEVLLCKTLTVERAYLYTHSNEPIVSALLPSIRTMLHAYRCGTPVAYLTGQRDFWDMTLSVTPDVLIPRPETELLVQLSLDRLCHGGRVLELGTGSGAIALAIARERPDAVVTATDISTAALEVAVQNAARYELDIIWLSGNWYAPVAGEFELIVSNPPYIAEDDTHLSALGGEPRLALVSGSDGLSALRALIAGAKHHLRADGCLLVEHGFDQARAVSQLFAAQRFRGITTVADLAGQPRVTLGQR